MFKLKVSNKIKSVIIISALIIVGGISFAITKLFSNPVPKFESYFSNKNYSVASTLYSKSILNTKYQAETNIFLTKQSNEIKQNLINIKTSVQDASNEVSELSKYKIDITNVKVFVDSLSSSNAAFTSANQSINNKNYLSAVDQLKKVIKEDKNYDNAQKLIKDQLDLSKKQKLDEAQNYASKEDYIKALASIDSMLKYLPNDTDLTDKENFYKQAKIDSDKVRALDILNKRNSPAKFLFNKIVTINGKEYYGFTLDNGHSINGYLEAINVDTGELLFYADDSHYLTEDGMKQQEIDKQAAYQKKLDEDVEAYKTGWSGMKYEVANIRPMNNNGTIISLFDYKSTNTSTKIIDTFATIVFYDNNNNILGSSEGVGTNMLRPGMSEIFRNRYCEGNISNYAYYKIVNEKMQEYKLNQ